MSDYIFQASIFLLMAVILWVLHSLPSAYDRGARDCELGREPRSNNEDYQRGYGDQYAIEQALDHFTDI